MFVHRSNRVERLADALAESLREGGDPFAHEAVVVQSRGMAQWLSVALARRLGVVAHIRWWRPRAFVEHMMDVSLGRTDADPPAWSRERTAWTLMRLLPELIDAPVFAPLQVWLRGAPEGPRAVARRWQLCHRIAYIFDQYAVYRPEDVAVWSAAGVAGPHVEGADAWQPVLWRALEEALGPHHVAARAQACLASGPPPVGPGGLPARAFVFGLTTVPPLYLHLLHHAAQAAPVHLFQLSPSDQWWADIRSKREQRQILRGRDPDFGPDAEASMHLSEGHPMLASLGRVGREFQLLLEDGPDYTEPHANLYEVPQGSSMLATLQRDVLEVRARALDLATGVDERVPMAADDRSVMVLGCHSPAREVEVLRDELLKRLHADPTLRPRDIVVLTPDISIYGPLVDAVFGVSEGEVHVPYTLADRPVVSGNEVARSLLDLLGLVGSRLAAPDVVDLLAHGPVRRRFGFTEVDVASVEALVSEAGVRWGRDAAHRTAFEQPGTDLYTWRFGLDRLLLGHAVDDARPVQGRIPVTSIEGDAADLVGRLAEYIDTVLRELDALAVPRTMGAWRDHLLGLLGRLHGDDEDAADEVQRLRDGLMALATHADEAAFDDAVPLAIVQDLLTSSLLEERKAGAFLRRGITFCEMLPMRSIPARIVVMLGLSDGVFPRSDSRLGFDLVAKHRRTGDRSKRDDDRYLVLEALLSARDGLIATYVSHSVQDNKPLPPSVVLADLLDTLDATFLPPAGVPRHLATRARDAVVVHHPLQPFSSRYVTEAAPGELASHVRRVALFTYDRGAFEGAKALAEPKRDAPPFVSMPLPPAEPVTEVNLDDLVRFVEDPVMWFLHTRLRVGRPADVVVLADREPLSIEAGLESWGLGQRMLDLKLEGLSWEACREVLEGEARLPLGQLAGPALAQAARRVQGILKAAHRRLDEPLHPPTVVEATFGDVRFTGRLDGLRSEAAVVLQYSSAPRGGGRHRMRAWVRHLALQLTPGPLPHVTELYARDGDAGGRALRYSPMDPREARARLGELVDAMVLGHASPLPFLPDAAWVFLREVRTGTGRDQSLRRAASEARAFWKLREESGGVWARLVGGDNALSDAIAPKDFAAWSEALMGPIYEHEAAQ